MVVATTIPIPLGKIRATNGVSRAPKHAVVVVREEEPWD